MSEEGTRNALESVLTQSFPGMNKGGKETVFDEYFKEMARACEKSEEFWSFVFAAGDAIGIRKRDKKRLERLGNAFVCTMNIGRRVALAEHQGSERA